MPTSRRTGMKAWHPGDAVARGVVGDADLTVFLCPSTSLASQREVTQICHDYDGPNGCEVSAAPAGPTCQLVQNTKIA